MPLLDHFHPPLSRRSWESFHTWWAGHLSGRLNMGPLPPRFIAEANIHIGIKVAADVAAFEAEGPAKAGADGTVATAVWAPPQPPLVVPVDFASLESFEIRVYDEEGARTLVAAVELVSPGNTNRPDARRAFLDKCAAYLREGVCVTIVDIVTSRRHNFHAALMKLLEGHDKAVRAVKSKLYAVAYRARNVRDRTQLEMWPTKLALGRPLPTLPLWLTDSLCVPLELEAAYREACRFAAIA
jgi:hypothetical protein